MRAEPPLRVALIGPGWSGRRFLRLLVRLPGYQVACVVGTRPGSASPPAAPGPVLPLDRYGSVLEDPTVRAVLICTPPATHVELARSALAADKHVLVEKPIGLDPAGIADLRIAALRSGRALVAAFQLAHHPLFAEVCGMVARGEVGSPVHAGFRMFVPRSRPAGAWLADPVASGGPFAETLVHGFHLTDLALGPVEALLSAAPYRQGGAVVGGVAVGRHRSGCVTTWETSWLGSGCVRAGFLEVTGTAGAAGCDRGFDGRRQPVLRADGTAGSRSLVGDDEAGHLALLRHFRAACRHGMTPGLTADLERAERALSLATAARELAGLGRPAAAAATSRTAGAVPARRDGFPEPPGTET